MKNFARQLSPASYTIIFLLQAVLIFDATNETPPQITRRFDENLKRWNENSLDSYELALSMGVVLHEPLLRENLEDLLHRADLVIYEVKEARKAQQK